MEAQAVGFFTGIIFSVFIAVIYLRIKNKKTSSGSAGGGGGQGTPPVHQK